MTEMSAVPTDAYASPLERAKTALMTEFGLFRHGANEVALEYMRWLALRPGSHAAELADDSLLRKFAERMGIPAPALMASADRHGHSMSDLDATYKALYGHDLPPCWAAGSASLAAIHSPAPTGQGRRSMLGRDPAPTGQRRLSHSEQR